MKRYAVLTVAMLVTVAMVISMMGCGGDTGKAREYMNQGDEYWTEAASASESMQENLNTLVTDLANGEYTSSADFKGDADDVIEETEEVIDGAKKAKAEYEKIKALSGVEDYVEYADLMIEAADKGTKAGNEIVDFLDKLSDTVAAEEAGQAYDYSFVSSDSEAISELGEDIEDLETQAQELKSQKNL